MPPPLAPVGPPDRAAHPAPPPPATSLAEAAIFAALATRRGETEAPDPGAAAPPLPTGLPGRAVPPEPGGAETDIEERTSTQDVPVTQVTADPALAALPAGAPQAVARAVPMPDAPNARALPPAPSGRMSAPGAAPPTPPQVPIQFAAMPVDSPSPVAPVTGSAEAAPRPVPDVGIAATPPPAAPAQTALSRPPPGTVPQAEALPARDAATSAVKAEPPAEGARVQPRSGTASDPATALAAPALQRQPAAEGVAPAIHPPSGYPAAPDAAVPNAPQQQMSAAHGTNPPERAAPDTSDLPELHVPPGGMRSAAPAQATAPLSAEATLARHGAQQIAGAVAQAPPQEGGTPERIELRLDPPELGRVRMTLSLGEHGISLHLAADRPETLELMRRHIGLLGAELARLGYGSADFSFDGGSGGQSQTYPGDARAAPAPGSSTAPTLAQPPTTNGAMPRGGLDLRL